MKTECDIVLCIRRHIVSYYLFVIYLVVCVYKKKPMFSSIFRNVFSAEVVNGKLETRKMVTVRFSEFEACVQTINIKVAEALGQQETFILTDSQGNEIVDSEGTRGMFKMIAVKIPFSTITLGALLKVTHLNS